MPAVTPSALRKDIYNMLDRVLETGKILEVKRKGEILKIIPPKKVSKLSKIKVLDILACDANDIITNNWEKEWKYDIS